MRDALARRGRTIIVDDQFQLGALRQLGPFVEVQSARFHTRAQRDMSSLYGPPTAGWQADRENGTDAHRATPRRTPRSRFKNCVETV